MILLCMYIIINTPRYRYLGKNSAAITIRLWSVQFNYNNYNFQNIWKYSENVLLFSLWHTKHIIILILSLNKNLSLLVAAFNRCSFYLNSSYNKPSAVTFPLSRLVHSIICHQWNNIRTGMLSPYVCVILLLLND